MPIDAAELTEATLVEFCKEFVEHPYLCYTEHGIHALFFARLLEKLPNSMRYFDFHGERVSAIQKEYPTEHDLGKSRRQNWDISVIKPPSEMPKGRLAYDNLPLAAVIEFGLNYGEKHILGDIARLSHDQTKMDRRLIAHFYRLSPSATRISGRDGAPKSSTLCTCKSIQDMLKKGNNVTVYYAMIDDTGHNDSGLWKVTAKGCELLAKRNARKDPKS